MLRYCSVKVMKEINVNKRFSGTCGTRDAVTQHSLRGQGQLGTFRGASNPTLGTRTVSSDLLQRPRCNLGQPPLLPVPILPPRRGREQYEPVAVVHARHNLDERELRYERQLPIAHLQRELAHGEWEPRSVVEHGLGYGPAVRVPQREAAEHARENGRAAGHEQDVGDVEGRQVRCVRCDERDCRRDGAG